MMRLDNELRLEKAARVLCVSCYTVTSVGSWPRWFAVAT